VSPLFLVRWSLRDLRRKWIQVTAIALVIAIGTGLYAALSGSSTWRITSNDDSFAMTGMYDLRARATTGADAAQGTLLAVLDTMADPATIDRAEERLVVDSPVDASTDDRSIRIPGRIVGLDVTGGGPRLTSVAVGDGAGRTLGVGDDGAATVVLERNFADYYGLRPGATVRPGGSAGLDVVGVGSAPEYFLITTADGGFFAQADFAVLFTSLHTAQDVTGRPGRVNDLVLTLRPGTDRVAARAELQAAFDRAGTGLGVTIMTRDEEPTYRVLYEDIESDAKLWNVIAGLILAGAGLGAFNLSSRMVESQRRELGIGMALGATRRQLALRPMLVALEISVASVVLGIGVGLAAVALIRPVFTGILPLPVWHTGFVPGPFVPAAALGFVIPLVASAWPVWRSVRMAPVDAITVTHRAGRSGLAPLLRRLRRPNSAFRRMPIGNVLRTPRRSVLTSLGIGAAVATLVALLGMMDSFTAGIDRHEREVLGSHPDRVVVALDAIVTDSGPEVAAVRAAGGVGAVEPVLRTTGHLTSAASGGAPGGDGFDVVLEALDLDDGLWTPSDDGTERLAGPGVVIARPAADDLGVSVGDTVLLTHPVRDGTGVGVATDEVTVIGVHPSPFRFNVYLDRSLQQRFGLAGLTNELFVLPAAGASTADVERSLFDLDGVSSVLPAATANRVVRDSLEQFTEVFRIAEGFVAVLALAMAYNTTSINADERARERATLFAFGLPVRRVVVLEMVEALLYGVAATAVGLALGAVLARWLVTSVWQDTMPELVLQPTIGSTTVLTAVTLGVVAVTAAPLLTVRRLLRMDVPGTLRVVE